jgi:leucyl aminopeptidase
MNPSILADAAQAHVGGPSVTVEVWDEQRIADERLGGLLGVARGSAEPPRLLRAVYEPTDPVHVDGRVPHVVLVGKGITFDSGGLSLKSAEGMVTMKTDMSAAAAVLATASACADMGVRVKVTAIAPVTENMPGGRAIKPGDVLTVRNGRTIEVLNTDAEGRLVLADALSLASELEPDAVVDLATLTGACIVALGSSVAGVFGSDQALVDKVRAAAERGGEATWPLPLVEDYRSHIDSDVADMKNVGKGGQAGAIAAALLLARFVEGTPWVHMDIAGPARSDEDAGVLAKGGTGFGVRTLLELLAEYASGSG